MSMSLIRLSSWKGVVAALAVAATIGSANDASAVVLAQWTFESLPDVPAASGNVAEGGVFAASSSAALATGGTLSSPVGNGSANSYSSNGWNVNEYFEFTTSSLLYEDITLTWDQVSSGTGPQDFLLQYSTGSGFTDYVGYVVLPNQAGAPGAGTWGGVTANPAYSYAIDLSALVSLDNAASLIFRLVMATTDDAAPPGAVAAAGTSRVDNFTVNGTLIPIIDPPAPVPLPSSLLVFGGCAGVAGVARRRLQAILG